MDDHTFKISRFRRIAIRKKNKNENINSSSGYIITFFILVFFISFHLILPYILSSMITNLLLKISENVPPTNSLPTINSYITTDSCNEGKA
jgi:hypothetical protein